MARIRTVKPELWTDAKIVSLPFEARLLFIGIWNFADDEGCLADEPDTIRLQVLPADQVDATALIELLVAKGLLERWESSEGRPFLRVTHFMDHQRVQHPTPSKLMPKARRLQEVHATSRALTDPHEPSPLKGREGNGGERNGREGKSRAENGSDAITGEVVDRPEVIDLCNLLADTIASDGTKRPTVSKDWQDECRRLLDIDEATVDQVRYVVGWVHRPGNFWAANILSMRKLREKWPTLTKEIRRTASVGSVDQLREWADAAA